MGPHTEAGWKTGVEGLPNATSLLYGTVLTLMEHHSLDTMLFTVRGTNANAAFKKKN